MVSTAQRSLQVSLTVPVAITVGWIAAVFMVPEMGPVAYAIPLIGPAIGLALIALYRSEARRSLTTVFLLFMATFVLSLAFRQRELGDTGLDWQNGTKLAVWCTILVIGLLRWRDLSVSFSRPMTGLAFACASIALLSAAWSEVPAYTAASAIGLLAYLVLACLAVRDLDEAVALRTIIWSLAAFLLMGLIAALMVFDVAWLAPSAEENLSRLQGFSGHPNTFGQQAAIFVTLTTIAARMGILPKFVAPALLLMGLVAILASGSRTNLAAALLAFVVIEVRASAWRHAIVITGMTTIAAIVLIAATGGLTEIDGLVRGFSRTGTEGEIFTLTGRTELWSAAWKLIVDKPVWGWGYNGIEDVIARTVSTGFEGTAVNAHNMMLQTLASLGFAGSLPAIAAIGLLCLRFFTRPDPARDQIAVLLLVTGLGEVGIAATPILLTLVVFIFLVRDDARFAQAASSPEGSSK